MTKTKTNDENIEQSEQGYVWVNAVKYNGITKDEEVISEAQEQLRVPNFNGLPVARITVSGHMTKNLGNYESARVGVEVSLPCLPVEEEIVRVYAEVQELVSDMLTEQLSTFETART
jgi:hypothetical protein